MLAVPVLAVLAVLAVVVVAVPLVVVVAVPLVVVRSGVGPGSSGWGGFGTMGPGSWD